MLTKTGAPKSGPVELQSSTAPALGEPDVGRVALGASRAPAARLELCAYMPQRDLLLPWLRAIDNAALALRVAGRSRAEARRLAAPLFERFGLGGFVPAPPHAHFGGVRP